ILRHGAAAERGSQDFARDSDRPLTAEGQKQLHNASRAMEKMGLDFDLVLSSPFLRARQTAEIVAKALRVNKRLEFSEALTPGGTVEALVRELNGRKPTPVNVLLVGHEPYLSRLISRLISGGEDTAMDFKKGGLCKLEANCLRAGKCAVLAWLLTPKHMKWMA
ncbi:MAG: phosphohistidine phosphatase SixA, partial [Verrucomicrobia bacterium]|nr:phosphohistidine phosphatase SixA [Verrucomicrobiota bacterium]